MQAQPYLIAQISDMHLKAEGTALFGLLDPLAAFDELLSTIKALPQRPDMILITGDLANDGEQAAYDLVNERMTALGLPWIAIPGNHDRRAGFPRGSIDLDMTGPGLAAAVDLGAIRLIALDSLVEGEFAGQLGNDQLDWLQDCLSDNVPTMIAVHHPPVITGIGHMDRIGLLDRDAFMEIAGGSSPVGAIVAGHVHRTIIKQCAGRIVMVAPSPVNAVGFSLDPDDAAFWQAEPPGFLLHAVSNGGEITSHRIAVGNGFLTGRFGDSHTALCDA